MELALERVLRLVADGRLTAEEAGPILDALGVADRRGGAALPGVSAGAHPARARGRTRGGRVPGLSGDQLAEIEQAVATGTRGPILDVEDADGDGVRIVLE